MRQDTSLFPRRLKPHTTSIAVVILLALAGIVLVALRLAFPDWLTDLVPEWHAPLSQTFP